MCFNTLAPQKKNEIKNREKLLQAVYMFQVEYFSPITSKYYACSAVLSPFTCCIAADCVSHCHTQTVGYQCSIPRDTVAVACEIANWPCHWHRITIKESWVGTQETPYSLRHIELNNISITPDIASRNISIDAGIGIDTDFLLMTVSKCYSC